MLKNSYLYGDNEVPEIPQEVIDERLRLLDNTLTELLEPHYEVRDDRRIRDVQRATSFWNDINKQ